jgi:hypothetical protein
MPPCVSPSLLVVDRHHSESDTKQRPLCHFHRRQAVGLKGSRSIGIGSIDRILPRVSDLVSPCQPRSFRRHRHRAGAGSGQNRSGGDHAVAVQRHRLRRRVARSGRRVDVLLGGDRVRLVVPDWTAVGIIRPRASIIRMAPRSTRHRVVCIVQVPNRHYATEY